MFIQVSFLATGLTENTAFNSKVNRRRYGRLVTCAMKCAATFIYPSGKASITKPARILALAFTEKGKEITKLL